MIVELHIFYNFSALATRCNSSVACMWALLASYNFYGTGHHATLGHVRWAPAFHAGDPNYLDIGPLITGSLVSLELFGKNTCLFKFQHFLTAR